MAIFNSYVSLPEGKRSLIPRGYTSKLGHLQGHLHTSFACARLSGELKSHTAAKRKGLKSEIWWNHQKKTTWNWNSESHLKSTWDSIQQAHTHVGFHLSNGENGLQFILKDPCRILLFHGHPGCLVENDDTFTIPMAVAGTFSAANPTKVQHQPCANTARLLVLVLKYRAFDFKACCEIIFGSATWDQIQRPNKS